jgi:6-phosphogluconolactonase
MGGSICVFTFEPVHGLLALRQTISTLPSDFQGPNSVAEIRLHPNDRFVYVSNRGHDSLAVFARDPEAGTLELVEIGPSGGGHPRNFALTPDGGWLLCANRDSNNVVVFRVDPASGRLAPTGRQVGVPEPVCVLFLSCL